ncbi:EAL domain-containing protein [Legionella sp. CNM-4043-24]|uniref:EAL domain-containing protein n=1 Tax=Legionella sp. CNM-4043-24 TaxID=3421646 RepID=UPI00403A9958
MINRLQSEHVRLKNKFGIGWLAFTLIFLFGMIFFGWKHFQLQKLQLFQQHANYLAFKIDGLIEHILETGQSLPYYKSSNGTCEDELFDKLGSTVFNHTDISGIVISDDKNKVLCASPEINTPLPPPGDASPVLLGPMKMSQGSNEVFLLQQRLGQYHVGIYLIRPLIEEYMRKHSTGIDSAGLYDNSTRKMLVQTGRPVSTNRLSDRESVITLPLQNLDNLSLVVRSHPLGFMKQLIGTIAMMTIPFLLLSWAFYLWCSRLINRRFSLQFALKNAMKNGEFQPTYQAIRDELQQRFCGAEVLIRWHTSQNEVIMPDYFIGEAEKTGLIVPMMLQLIEKSFEECQQLLQTRPYMYLAFNLSPCHFRDAHFFATFYDLCSRFHIQPEQVMLELTERELFNEQDEAVVEKMNELRQRGYLLAIDDFGTGQSNIHYLQHFPFNYLKIDKLFISSIGTGAITETLNHSIINMARSLQLKIIAEGVETQTQLDYLRSNQVFLIQGWYYTRALPYDAFARLM